MIFMKIIIMIDFKNNNNNKIISIVIIIIIIIKKVTHKSYVSKNSSIYILSFLVIYHQTAILININQTLSVFKKELFNNFYKTHCFLKKSQFQTALIKTATFLKSMISKNWTKLTRRLLCVRSLHWRNCWMWLKSKRKGCL